MSARGDVISKRSDFGAHKLVELRREQAPQSGKGDRGACEARAGTPAMDCVATFCCLKSLQTLL